MNAAVFYGPNDIRIENIEIDTEKSSERYLLKVISCSVCSYDVRTFRNGSFKVIPPIILGHEICAEMVDEYTGKNVSIKPKTRVSIYPVIPCFNCWYCSKKKYNLCSNLKEIGSTFNGGYAEYITIPKKIFEIGGMIPVPDNVSNEEASLVEPLACCMNSFNQIKMLEFYSIIIIGDGPIGLMQLMLFKKFFNKKVTMIGKIKHRLETAKKLGADLVVCLNEDDKSDDIKMIKEINEEFSPNLIFVSNNNPNSINLALELVNKNGKIVIFSGIKKSANHANNITLIDPNFIHYNQVSILGSFSSTPENLGEAMNLIHSREIKISDLITDTFSLEDIESAFHTFESFKGLKTVINKF